MSEPKPEPRGPSMIATILNTRPRWTGQRLTSITIDGTEHPEPVTLSRATLLALMAETARLLGAERGER